MRSLGGKISGDRGRPSANAMRSENIAKIALNAAVKLQKVERVNGKSWSPRTMVAKDLRQRSMLT